LIIINNFSNSSKVFEPSNILKTQHLINNFINCKGIPLEVSDNYDFIPFQLMKLNQDKIIGEGAFGVVLCGTLFNSSIAVKKIYKHNFLVSGLNEMYYLRKMNCKQVIKYYGYSEDNDFIYIILE
jgi:hypothetical protein